MEIIEVPVNRLRPDPDQPRQIFDDHLIDEMATSLKYDPTSGAAPKMINPIEVDKNYMIVTGEMRWRSAKRAGLSSVPVKVIDPGDGNERFLRQVKENIHRSSMTAWDIANALKKLYDNLATSRQVRPHAPQTGITKDEGIRELARRLGKDHEYISSMLDLLGESDEVKEALKDDKVSWTYIRDANVAPEEYREPLKKRILEGEFSSREGMTSLARALKNRPDKEKELWEKDYHGMSGEQMIKTVHDIAPTPFQQIGDSTDKASKLISLAENLSDWLSETTLKEIPPLMQPRMVTVLTSLVGRINQFVRTLPNPKALKEGGENEASN